MKKRINKSKVLFVLTLLFGIFYGISTLLKDKKEPPFPFEADLIQVDTHTISSIDLFLKSEDFEKITLQKEQSDWLVTKKNFTTKANKDTVSQLLKTLHVIHTDQIVANQSSMWKQFGIKNQQSNQVQIYINGVLKENFHITTAAFTQKNIDTSFIRFIDQNEVYSTNSYVSINVDKGFNAYRKKHILDINPNNLVQIEMTNTVSTDTIVRKEKKWMWHETILDSLKMTYFIQNFQKISGTTFVDDFDELDNEKLLTHQLKLTYSNQPDPILIRCYTDTLRAKPFIIHSNTNKDAYFASDSTEIYQRLFKNVSDFIK